MSLLLCSHCNTHFTSSVAGATLCPKCSYTRGSAPSSPARASPIASAALSAPGFSAAPSSGAYPGAPPVGTYGYGSVAVGQPRTSGMAVASVVLGAVGALGFWIPYIGFFAFVAAILAIVFGSIGIGQTNRNPTLVGGKGLAITGLVLGIVAIAAAIFMVLFFLYIFFAFFRGGWVVLALL